MNIQDNKKLYYMTAIFALCGLIFLALNQYFKTLNVQDAMHRYHMNVSGLWIYKSEKMINNKTQEQVKSYKVSYDDLNLSKHCKGFIILEKNGTMIKDVICQ